MDEAFVVVYVLIGFLLRIGIPVGITFLLGWSLRKLDTRWRLEARQNVAQPKVQPKWTSGQMCWQENDCSLERRQDCPAFLNPEIPCWEFFRKYGTLNKMCTDCQVRQQAFASTAVYVAEYEAR
jgi:hypothetical protein